MNLKKISAYYVYHRPEPLSLRGEDTYLRLEHNLWYCTNSDRTKLDRVLGYDMLDLEAEFQETISVIHEQIPLL